MPDIKPEAEKITTTKSELSEAVKQALNDVNEANKPPDAPPDNPNTGMYDNQSLDFSQDFDLNEDPNSPPADSNAPPPEVSRHEMENMNRNMQNLSSQNTQIFQKLAMSEFREELRDTLSNFPPEFQKYAKPALAKAGEMHAKGFKANAGDMVDWLAGKDYIASLNTNKPDADANIGNTDLNANPNVEEKSVWDMDVDEMKEKFGGKDSKYKF